MMTMVSLRFSWRCTLSFSFTKKTPPLSLACCSRPGHLQGLAVLLINPCHHLEFDPGLAKNEEGGIEKPLLLSFAPFRE